MDDEYFTNMLECICEFETHIYVIDTVLKNFGKS